MRIENPYGLTLTELLIAAVMVSIVMAGLAVFSTSMKQMMNTSQTTRYTDMKLAAVMKAIRKDAELAIGDPTDPGIIAVSASPKNGICFRQDTMQTPSDYTDDVWACWYHHSSSPGMRRCYNVPRVNVPTDSNAKCDSAASTRDYFELDNAEFYTVTNNPQGQFQSVTIHLTAHDTRIAADALENPSKSIIARISPQMISR
ncbi:MAG: hypothetical protein K8I00_02960 [Candidatus Omnitrophica bacterium]|nr:hypothetical protein [Candidatus Omnitrophota bacterium]